MKFSKSTELAIHGLWLLAKKKQGAVLVSELADQQNVSESYLAKVFQRLVHKGLVHSCRGKHGGFFLAKAPECISMADVTSAMDVEKPLFDCLAQDRGCTGKDNCMLRSLFCEAEKQMLSVLEKVSLADLLHGPNGKARATWLR